MLRFKAKGRAIAVGLAAFERIGSPQEVAAIELDTGLVRENGHRDARYVAPYGGCHPDTVFGIYGLIQHEVVIIAMPELYLPVGAVADMRADPVGKPKVERGARDGLDLASGDQG